MTNERFRPTSASVSRPTDDRMATQRADSTNPEHTRELERMRAHTRAIERASGAWSRRGLPGVSRDWSEWTPRANAETRAPRSNETYDAYARYVERRDEKTRGARRLLLARGEAEEEAEA